MHPNQSTTGPRHWHLLTMNPPMIVMESSWMGSPWIRSLISGSRSSRRQPLETAQLAEAEQASLLCISTGKAWCSWCLLWPLNKGSAELLKCFWLDKEVGQQQTLLFAAARGSFRFQRGDTVTPLCIAFWNPQICSMLQEPLGVKDRYMEVVSHHSLPIQSSDIGK
jgi:hypothetical protein